MAHDRLKLIAVDSPTAGKRVTSGVTQRVRIAKPAIEPGAPADRGEQLSKGVPRKRPTALADEYESKADRILRIC